MDRQRASFPIITDAHMIEGAGHLLVERIRDHAWQDAFDLLDQLVCMCDELMGRLERIQESASWARWYAAVDRAVSPPEDSDSPS